MPHRSPLDITASDRGFANHRVHGGLCDVNPLGDMGDVLFPLVLPQGRQDLRDVPRRRDPFFHGEDAPTLCEAMVDHGPSPVRTVLDGASPTAGSPWSVSSCAGSTPSGSSAAL
jgi:hypothetical protein